MENLGGMGRGGNRERERGMVRLQSRKVREGKRKEGEERGFCLIA